MINQKFASIAVCDTNCTPHVLSFYYRRVTSLDRTSKFHLLIGCMVLEDHPIPFWSKRTKVKSVSLQSMRICTLDQAIGTIVHDHGISTLIFFMKIKRITPPPPNVICSIRSAGSSRDNLGENGAKSFT